MDVATLRTLAELEDRIGVLSLYVTADPHDESSQPAWRTRARTELKRLREAAKHNGSREEHRAIASRLNSLDSDLESLLDSRTPGLGRAMFAAISNGRVELIRLQVPLGDNVGLAPTADLRPLVAAWSQAGPAGAIAISVDEVRIFDVRFGTVTEVVAIPHPEDVADRRELTGKGHATPTTTHHSSASHHDLFEQREGDRIHRYLSGLGPILAGHVDRHGWEFMVLAGEVKYVNAVAQGIPATSAEVLRLPHTVTTLTPARLAVAVEPALGDARAARNRVLVERVIDAAMSSNSTSGACGLAATLAALQEGRVAHLVFSEDGTWSGRRDPDGILIAGTEPPPGGELDELVSEPRLDERMIELAIRERASITVVDTEAAAPLADHDGIGALLRW